MKLSKNRVCRKCGNNVCIDKREISKGYSYYCPNCDEDLYTFETFIEKQNYKEQIMSDILEEIDNLASRYKLDSFLFPYFTKRDLLVFYDTEEKKTLRDSQGRLLHGEIAIQWLENEAIDGEILDYLYEQLDLLDSI